METTVRIDGMTLGVTTAGTGDPVVLVHGSHRSRQLWQRNIPALAEHFTVFAVDLPGYGSSTPIGADDPLPDMPACMHAALHQLGYDSAHWVGESRGGGIVIQLGVRYPDAVRNAVLISPVGLPPDELPKPPELGARSKWDWFVERSFGDPGVAEDLELRKHVVASMAKAETYEHRRAAAVTSEYNRYGLLREIVSFRAPTLLIWGRQDPVFPVECAERFRELLPDVRQVCLIEGGRHLPHYEFAAFVNGEIISFLRSN